MKALFYFQSALAFLVCFLAKALHLSQSLGIAEYFIYFILNICHDGLYFPFLSISMIAFACGLSKSSFVFCGSLKISLAIF